MEKYGTLEKNYFGTTKTGQDIYCYNLKSKGGLEAHILNYGAILQKLLIPNSSKGKHDVVLGFDNLHQYEAINPYFGVIVGRNANRIAGGEITIDDKKYQLSQNEGAHQLHGGFEGFGKKVWQASADGDKLILNYLSPDGEEGYPGDLKITASFEWEGDSLIIAHHAITNKKTVVNLSRHEYWNLAQSDNILKHKLKINADAYLPKNEDKIPTGEFKDVGQSVMDLRELSLLRSKLAGFSEGFDHNYVLNDWDKETPAAVLVSPQEDLKMSLFCTQPGLQFYSAANIGEWQGKYGKINPKSPALCLEPQHFPDALHHADFPSTILAPEAAYNHEIKYQFEILE